jgi:DNA-binding transcriptional regulator YhcF (GntR family)
MVKRIIDKRKKEKFMMDDAYLNGQARICGWQATLVYNSLCRHANTSQESFPSIKLMGEELAISKDTVMKGLEKLEKYNVIQVKKNRTKNGQWLNNTYTLIDKTEWIKDQVADTNLVSQVADTDSKETHIQGNTYKETHKTATSENVAINEILNIFKNKINTSINFGNITERKATAYLLKEIGFEKLSSLIDYAVSIQGEKYAPVITTPYQLKDKLAQLKIYFTKQKQGNKKIGEVI